MFVCINKLMAALVLEFNPSLHQKVRYHDQLYVVCLDEFDFFSLPPDAGIVIHFISQNKILYHQDESIQQMYTVKKRELIIVEQHATQ